MATADTTTEGKRSRFDRFLYRLTLLVAAGLGLLILCAPLMPTANDSAIESARQLLSSDAAVRKTTIAGAIGLWVTASAFFRPATSSATPRKTP